MSSFDSRRNLSILEEEEEDTIIGHGDEKLSLDQKIPAVNYGVIEYATKGDEPRANSVHLQSRSTERKFQRFSKSRSFSYLRGASLSMSMVEKPSDDRYASAFLAGWNVSNLIQGTGILGVPYAVMLGGWASVASIFLVALICCYTGKLLIGCLYQVSKRTNIKRRVRINYPEVGGAVLPKCGHVLVSIVQATEMFGGVIMYIVLLGTVFSDLLEHLTGLGIYEWAAICCLVVLPSLFIHRMSIISWFSMLAVFSLMSSIAVLIIYCFTRTHLWRLENMPSFDPQTFPIGFGIIVFSYCAHAVFPSIEASMKRPESFNPMMNWAFLLAALVKAVLGTFMVMAFGKKTEQVCTTNLKDSIIFTTIASVLVVLNVLLAVPLAMFVVSMTFDDAFMRFFPYLNRDSSYHWVWVLMTRPLLLCFALFLALVVPHFGLLMGLVGSFTGSCLCFIFPCLFHLKLKRKKMSIWEIGLDLLIVTFGLIAGSLGLFFSAKELVKTFTGF